MRNSDQMTTGKTHSTLPCQDLVFSQVEVDSWPIRIDHLKLVSFDSHIYKSCLDLFELLPNPTVHLLPVLPFNASTITFRIEPGSWLISKIPLRVNLRGKQGRIRANKGETESVEVKPEGDGRFPLTKFFHKLK